MRIVDLCCGAGGAAMGLHQAFPEAEIVGVDIRPMPRYPFTFVQGDALAFDLTGFDFVWASPPCQEHSITRGLARKQRRDNGTVAPAHHRDILVPIRKKLVEWGGPWIIENVVGAPLFYTAQLCAASFGLRTYRHRRFEAPFMLLAPPHLRHVMKSNAHCRSTGGLTRKASYLAGETFAMVAGNAGNYCGPGAMGIDWMLGRELSQAVPPAYSRYLAQFIPLPVEVAA